MPVLSTRLFPSGSRCRTQALAAWALAVAACVGGPAFAQARNPPLPGDYRVTDGRVDRGTYIGWRLFHTTCYGCHGVGGVGTDLAPNLVERVKTMTPRAFAAKVLTSYRLVSPGEEGSELEATLEALMQRERGSARGLLLMPAWESHANVPPHVLDLYAYLSARADGMLGPGRPKAPLAPRR
jgi:mono/diheme cytochrome c family protein